MEPMNPTNKKHRIAIIGRTGRGNYGHGLDRVWLDVDDVEIVAVADDNDAGRAACAKRLRAKKAYADYREMLEKERPQIVSVAQRWIDKHHEMVLACADVGASVFLEKPFCQDLRQADELVRACEEKKIKLAIAHQTRYSPKIPVIRKILESGRLGNLLEMRGRGKEDHRGGGEDLWVLGTHIFDLMLLFGGEATSCFARVTQKGRPITEADVRSGNEGIGPLAGDHVEAIYEFSSGISASFSSCRRAAGNPSRFALTILGSKGALEMRTGYLPETHVLDDPAWSPGRTSSKWIPVSSAGVGKPEPLANKGSHQANILIVRDLIDSIEKDRKPLGDVYSARAATEMIAAVFESHRQGRPVQMPLENRDNPLSKL